eukprot:TRINITY_DN2047_c0_g1_i6.p1 TRINITY_DN2047_c0_g1~~TRINITY_DN2047_c0_g1_i6.p1  ORF type:complete len:339 (-),score=78.57 TRINITY_DN2047_c0_g1_i6:189-1205(-)
MAITSGDFFEDYIVLEELGRGTFSVVVKAKCVDSGAEHGLFVLLAVGASSLPLLLPHSLLPLSFSLTASHPRAPRTSKRLRAAVKVISKRHVEYARKELEIMKNLSHPHIVKLLNIYESETKVFVVMEYADGGELFSRIEQKNNYTEEDAKVLVQHILEAVQYLHEHDVVHRDLKPENLLLRSKTSDTDVLVADFGLAKILQGDIMARTSCGSPFYVAPEVLMQEGYDNLVDLWSVGVITYTLLCGYLPFNGEQMVDTLQQILEIEYSYDDPIWDGVSVDAKDFIGSLLCPADKRMSAAQALTVKHLRQRTEHQQKMFSTSGSSRGTCNATWHTHKPN